MKEFKLQVPDGLTKCNNCPFINNISICLFLRENEYCIKYDFSKAHLWEINKK